VQGLCELHRLCNGADAAVRARAQRAAAAGFIEVVVAAVRTHQEIPNLVSLGCISLTAVCGGDDAAGRARKQRAAEAGAIEAVVEAMRAHPQAADMQERTCRKNVPYLGCMLLTAVCGGDDAAGRACKQRAAEAGAIEAVVEAMRAHPQAADMQEDGCKALLTVCGGGASAAARARRQRAAQAGGRTVVVGAMQAHPGNRDVQLGGQEVLNALPA